jgi:hypothetical protein
MLWLAFCCQASTSRKAKMLHQARLPCTVREAGSRIILDKLSKGLATALPESTWPKNARSLSEVLRWVRFARAAKRKPEQFR